MDLEVNEKEMHPEMDMDMQMKSEAEVEGEGAAMKTSAKRKSPTSKRIDTKAGIAKARTRKGAKSEKSSSPLEMSALKQKAMDLMQKGGEEISHRYAHAFDDMKDVSKKVQEQMKDKPYQIAMSAAGVVGLGMVLAKRFNQRHSKPHVDPSPHI